MVPISDPDTEVTLQERETKEKRLKVPSFREGEEWEETNQASTSYMLLRQG
jgi:hypothetical protein